MTGWFENEYDGNLWWLLIELSEYIIEYFELVFFLLFFERNCLITNCKLVNNFMKTHGCLRKKDWYEILLL